MNNMKIGARLGLGFGALLVLLLGIAILGVNRMGHIQANLDQIVNVNGYQAQQALAMRGAVHQTGALARNIVLLNEPAAMQAEAEKLRSVRATYDAADRDLHTSFSQRTETSNEEKALLATTRDRRDAARPALDKVIELGLANRNEEATRVLMTESAKSHAAWVESINALADHEDKLSAEAATLAAQSYATARTVVVAISVFALLAGVLIAWRLTVGITRPIAEAVAVAQTVAAGDLTSRIETKSRDETGQLLRALQAMNGALVEVVSQVRASSDSISTGATQIATGNADLSQRTEEQASNLEETAASMEELTSTIQSNAETARQASQLASSASAVAAKGGDVVGQVVSTMQDITQSSRKISDIIGVIDGIAFQTNILALNAAVEAARAGEQGRGFAVVASEVRSLAGRSAEAAKEIKTLIGASVERVEVGSRLVADAGETMADIVAQVKRVADLIGEISAATSEQSSGIGQVGEAVTQLDQVTQQNAALVEESAAAADSLNQQAARLVQAVSVFKLEAAARGNAAPRPTAPRNAVAKAPVLAAPGKSAKNEVEWETF